MQLEDHFEEHTIECELQGDDVMFGKDRFLEVKNLPAGFSRDKYVESGGTTLYAEGALIDDDLGVIYLSSGAAVATVSYFDCSCSPLRTYLTCMSHSFVARR